MYKLFTFGAKVGNFTVDTFKLGEYVFASGHSNILTTIKDKQKQTLELNLYPNPVTNLLNIVIENYRVTSNSCIDIYDMQGKMVKRITIINSENAISIDDLAPGQYILNLVDRSKKVANKTFIIE